MGKQQPEADSAIVWFNGLDPDHQLFAEAVADGGFDLDYGFDGELVYDRRRAWPAALEQERGGGHRGFDQVGRRLGVDVVRGCLVVEIDGAQPRQRVVINLGAANFVVSLGRQAIADQ